MNLRAMRRTLKLAAAAISGEKGASLTANRKGSDSRAAMG